MAYLCSIIINSIIKLYKILKTRDCTVDTRCCSLHSELRGEDKSRSLICLNRMSEWITVQTVAINCYRYPYSWQRCILHFIIITSTILETYFSYLISCAQELSKLVAHNVFMGQIIQLGDYNVFSQSVETIYLLFSRTAKFYC